LALNNNHDQDNTSYHQRTDDIFTLSVYGRKGRNKGDQNDTYFFFLNQGN